MATDARAQVVIDGDGRPLRQVLRDATRDMRVFGSAASTSIGGVANAAMGFRTQMIGIVATITGGAFTAFIKQQIDLQDQFSKSAQKAGVTTEQFSAMAYAAKLADLSNEDLIKSYAKLGAALIDAQQGQKEAVDLFRRLKLDPQNINDADQLLLALAERFAKMEDGAKKTALAVDIFGEKLGPRLIPFLNAGREGIEALRKEAAELGVVVSTRAGRDAEQFNDNLTRLSTAAKGAGMQLATELLPSLVEASEYFAKATKEAGFFEGVLISIGALMAKALGIDEAGKLRSSLASTRDEMGRLKGSLAEVNGLLERDPTNSVEQRRFINLTRRLEELREKAVTTAAELAKLDGAKSGRGAHGGGVNWALIGRPPDFDPETKRPTGGTKKSSTDGPSSYMQFYELQLAEEKHVQSVLESGREFGKERELAYWQWIIGNLQVTSADRVSILRKMAQLEVEISRKGATDRAAIDAERAGQAEAMALGKLDAERAANRASLDMGLITNDAFLQLDANLEQQRYEIQRAALVARLELLANDPTSSPLERERINGRLLELERQYQAQRIEIMGDVAKEGAGGDFWNGMSGSFTNAIDGMLFHAQTWSQALGNIFRSAGSAFVKEMVTEPFAKWLVMQAKLLAAKLGFLGQEEAANLLASGKNVALKGAETTAITTANAVQAGTGAAASQAPIPIVGPMLALAAMAAIFAAVSSFGKGKSAAGGYDIPSGINPMVQTHEEEMILPKQISNGFRQLFAEGGAPGRRGGDIVNVHLNALDSRTGVDWLVDNCDGVAAAMRRARRNNND